MNIGSKLSNRETVKLLLQNTLCRDDVCRLFNCGHTKSSAIISDIQKTLRQNNIKTMRGIISSDALIDYMKWDLNSIIEKARIENELGI